MIILCMDKDVYQFRKQNRIKKEGGPIGLKLTGEVADCLMIDWVEKLLVELKKYKMVPEIYTTVSSFGTDFFFCFLLGPCCIP